MDKPATAWKLITSLSPFPVVHGIPAPGSFPAVEPGVIMFERERSCSASRKSARFRSAQHGSNHARLFSLDKPSLPTSLRQGVGKLGPLLDSCRRKQSTCPKGMATLPIYNPASVPLIADHVNVKSMKRHVALFKERTRGTPCPKRFVGFRFSMTDQTRRMGSIRCYAADLGEFKTLTTVNLTDLPCRFKHLQRVLNKAGLAPAPLAQ